MINLGIKKMQSTVKKLQGVPAFSFILTKYFMMLLAIGILPFLGYSIGEDLTPNTDDNLIQEAHAEQLIEGVKYKVLIEESIGTADRLR